MSGTVYTWCIAVFNSGLWNIPTPVDQALHDRVVGLQTRVKICSFSKFSVTSPTSQLILQPFRRFTYVTTHSPTLPLLHLRHFTHVRTNPPTLTLLHLRHNSFSNPSVALSTSQLILQPFRYFTYVTLPASQLILQPFRCFTYVTLPTSQLILQPFHRFTYVTTHSPTLQLLHLPHNSLSNPSIALPT